MAEGFIDSAWEGTKKVANTVANGVSTGAATVADATTNAARSGAEGVRSHIQDITLNPDEIVLLETDAKFQMGTEVIDGKLTPAEQQKLAQKVIQNFKTRREIDELLEKVKHNGQLTSLIKSYAFPDREKGTALAPSTDGQDVGMFVESAFGTVSAIGTGALNMTRWGESPSERIDNLQKEVILQAKHTRFAVHNMISKNPDWWTSPRHASSGIVDPYLPWNTLADRDARSPGDRDDIAENTPEHPLEYLESIIDVMVGAARNPKNLDQNLNPRDANIVIPGEIRDKEVPFGSNYENELLFALQFLQAMEKGANSADDGMILTYIKEHPVIAWGSATLLVSFLLVRYGLIPLLKKLTPGGKIGKVLSPLVAGAEFLGSEIEKRTAKNRAITTEITGEKSGDATADGAKFEIVEGVKVPKEIAEFTANMLKKLWGETPLSEATFITVELDELGNLVSGTDAEDKTLSADERIRRASYIRKQLKLFGAGKIGEAELKEGATKWYDGRYRYEGIKGILSNVGPIGANTKTALWTPVTSRWERVKKMANVTKAVGKDAFGVAGNIGVGSLEQLTRKWAQKVGIGGNLQTEATAYALRNADKLEPYAFNGREWKLDGSSNTKTLLKDLEVLLLQKTRLEEAERLLGEVKDKRLALEDLETKLSNGTIPAKLKTVTHVAATVLGVPAPPPVEWEVENPAYGKLLTSAESAREKLSLSLSELRKTKVQTDGINIWTLSINSDSTAIDTVLGEINAKLNTTGVYADITAKLNDIGANNTGKIIPTLGELHGKTFIEVMEHVLGKVGKIKIEPKI